MLWRTICLSGEGRAGFLHKVRELLTDSDLYDQKTPPKLSLQYQRQKKWLCYLFRNQQENQHVWSQISKLENYKMKSKRQDGPDDLGLYRPWQAFGFCSKYNAIGGFQARLECDVISVSQRLLYAIWRIGCTSIKWKQECWLGSIRVIQARNMIVWAKMVNNGDGKH